MNIYEILEEIERLSPDDFVDLETGEYNEEAFKEAMDALQMEKDKKLENIALFRKNLVAEADAVKAESKTLAERAKALENKADRLKSYLAMALCGEKFSTSRVAISWRKSESVVCEDATALPEEYQRVKTTVDADKTAIKDAIKNGVVIPGCHIEVTNNIQIK